MRRHVWMFVALATMACASMSYAETRFVWNFDAGDLTVKEQVGGTAAMSYFDAATQSVTDFGNTATTAAVPNTPGGPAAFLHHTQFGNGGVGGYGIDYTGVPANSGGFFVNTYTMLWDLYIPTINWTPFFNTNPSQGNDADFYVNSNGALGIGALGYSAPGTVQAGRWYRIGLVHDHGTGTVKYYVDGTEVFSGAVGTLDARFSLYTDSNPGLDLILDGEGDSSGNYTNEVYLSSFLFTDVAYDPSQMAQLGGVTASGLGLPSAEVIPEPATLALLSLAACALGGYVRRRRMD